MKVVEINGSSDADDLDSLETILTKKYRNGYNSFWLSHGSQEYPALSLLVKDDLATLTYIPNDQSAGYRSIGNIPTLKPGYSTSFSISNSPADDVVVLNEAILPFSIALKVAKEFFVSERLPQSVQWLEL